MTGTVYGWFVAQGLWPTVLSALLFWGLPVTLTYLLSRKHIAKAWADLTGLWQQHNIIQQAKADHLQTIAERLDMLTAPTKPPV